VTPSSLFIATVIYLMLAALVSAFDLVVQGYLDDNFEQNIP
jgi:hypothetical protein